MPIRPMPSYKSTPDKRFEISNPGIGGLNLKDLEFAQPQNQSPSMMNMMYRNGVFSKRYGQMFYDEFDTGILELTPVKRTISNKEELLVHTGNNMYLYSRDGVTSKTVIASNIPNKKGLFVKFAQNVYYFNDGYYVYKRVPPTTSGGVSTYVWETVTPYIPTSIINGKPDGSYGDSYEDLNIIGNRFSEVYHGDGTSKKYVIIASDELKANINWSGTFEAEVNGKKTTAFTVSQADGGINFTTAPSEGDSNVTITIPLKADANKADRDKIYGCRHAITFGGNNNSRLFLAGGGESKYFYSDSYDATYFPESNWATLGNSEYDIEGFGLQYNVLIIFKPNEMYSLTSYIQTSGTTIVEEEIGLEAFKAQLVNATIGCDAPNSIQLIDNRLVWVNSRLGVCTLVSTNIIDERNVRVISRNIERRNGFNLAGLLDYGMDLQSVVTCDYDRKYFVVIPLHGVAFVWDYEISPYAISSSKETDPKYLSWFYFSNFHIGGFAQLNEELICICRKPGYVSNLLKLGESFYDYWGESEDGHFREPIKAHYMTPFLDFGLVDYLKTVKNIYIQCRGDTATVINIGYYTDETAYEPEQEHDPIRIGGKLWAGFRWDTFQWKQVNWANTFRRKCSLKKIQLAAFYFDNEEIDRDMNISSIAMSYSIVKNVK